jgi:hypothetical protein
MPSRNAPSHNKLYLLPPFRKLLHLGLPDERDLTGGAESSGRVVLEIPSAKVDDMDFERPSFMGTRERRNVWPD